MGTAQLGDRVRVHYVKHLEDGSVVSSHGRAPLELTVGVDSPRLPGLGSALVGQAPGTHTTVTVPAERAYGQRDAGRIYRLARTRFADYPTLRIGTWVRITDRRGRRRRVRIIQVSSRVVVVDANHRWAGQTLTLEVELLAVQRPEESFQLRDSEEGPEANTPRVEPSLPHQLALSPLGGKPPPNQPRAIAFDVDPASLASLRQAFPKWEIETVNGATTDSLRQDWSPRAADLLVVGTCDEVGETLGLCRGLRSQLGRARTPLLVLVPPAREALVRAALGAGANSCLGLPVHPKELVAMVSRVRASNRPGRHTLNLDRAQHEDRWRDDGGQG
jgi:peptidylprolyl isomerase